MEKSHGAMKIAIIGSRGIPARYGGFETLTEELSLRLHAKGIHVTVICDASSYPSNEFKGIRLSFSKYTKADNPVRYYYDSLRVACGKADIILVCGVGGSVFYPRFRNCRSKIITHVDGREELRGKYSLLKKAYVRLAQLFTRSYSAHLICDSLAVQKYWQNKFSMRDGFCSTIEFGADPGQHPDNSILRELQLEPGSYFLVVCRMVPENNIEMILQAYRTYEGNKRLVLVGNTSGNYGKNLRALGSPRVLFLNSLYDKEKLFALRKNCFGYIHGHTVGGTNPSLLEAMAAGNACICHDNEYNRETTGNSMLYFRNAQEIASQMKELEEMGTEELENFTKEAVRRIETYYNWDRIANEYEALFKSIITE